MGLFFKNKENCCICGNEEGKKKIANGFICKDCLHLCSIPFQVKINKNMTKEVILNEIEDNKNNKKLLSQFTATKKIKPYIEFDKQNKLWLIPDGVLGKKLNPKVYKFEDILEFELLEDGESITKGGLGRAVAGGVLLGGVGAVVGGVTGKKKTKSIINSLRIKITVNYTSNPAIYVELIKTKTKSNSTLYKIAYSQAQEILSMLSVITKNEKVKLHKQEDTISVADEIRKLSKLVEDGLLTQEEFANEKNKILNK
ncbi:SHOCT domain-containing protein [Clostridium brassicae]|uniref:SHOCT domain-containing protein n=1 Tax=Clostridium brassicae TaxID=2999072 RepID=A0ABT4D9A8_9CLOT|nr:SHOCT domain-containing protein [Clostridium brassicae]MCY6958872.1 SHOCT domain-containing protein [Clostridium brassicae]